MSCWFVKADGLSVDYLFHDLLFERDAGPGWRAVDSPHLCEKDNYESEYRFCFNGIDIAQWELGYAVNGPRKEYRTKAVYTRP